MKSKILHQKQPKAIDSILVSQNTRDIGVKKRQINFRVFPTWIFAVLLTFIIICMGVGLHFWHNSHHYSQNEEALVVQEVGKLYILPTNEQPALATITDKSKLATPFLQKADDGDKVLIYIKAKIVIIYRPSVNKIVAVGPVDINNPPQTQTSSASN